MSEFRSCVEAITCTESEDLYQWHLMYVGIAKGLMFLCQQDTLTGLWGFICLNSCAMNVCCILRGPTCCWQLCYVNILFLADSRRESSWKIPVLLLSLLVVAGLWLLRLWFCWLWLWLDNGSYCLASWTQPSAWCLVNICHRIFTFSRCQSVLYFYFYLTCSLKSFTSFISNLNPVLCICF